MYSPTTRLLTVLELLQSHSEMSGPELARRLEVSERSVRRYIVMLQDMGIPIEAERGRHGAYRLRRGFKMPPLMVNDGEAVALTLGLIALREFRLPVEAAAAEGALAKVERVMPEKLLQKARALREAITFNVELPANSLQQGLVSRLSTAVHQGHRVRLLYRAFNGRETEREFDPYGIVFNQGFWYAPGYCHLRQGLRTFRLDRVVSVEPAPGTFKRPSDFDALAVVMRSLIDWPDADRVEILLRTSLGQARELIAETWGTLREVDGGVVFTRPAHDLGWLPIFLLSLDFPAEVLRPASLREEMRDLARRAVAFLRAQDAQT